MMNLQLRRWLRFTTMLVVVLILCWQTSTSSATLNSAAARGISATLKFFGNSKVTAGGIYFAVRKLGHFVVFAILGLCGHLAIAGVANDSKSAITCSMVVNTIIALVAEFCQAYALDRTATFKDALVNLSGAALGILIGLIVESVRRKRATR